MNRSLLASYVILLVLLTFFSYAFVDPNLFYLKPISNDFYKQQRLLTTLCYLSITLIFFLFYIFFIKNIKKINLRAVILLSSFILFFSYPSMFSYDIFNYIQTSRVIFKFHENPYIVMPLEISNDPNLIFTRATNKTALYGPSWIAISTIPYLLGFGNFILTLFNFKFLSLFSYLGAGFLIYKITRSSLSTALFSLNPLVLIESLVSSHNDVFMIFFALLSFYLLRKRRIIKSIISLVFSILVKFATIFLLPIFLFTLYKTIRGQKINWEHVYLISSVSMIFIFLLSPLREEIYPWYAVWFIAFSSLIPNIKWLFYLSIASSLGLSLSYIPYMFFGTYSSSTLALKTFIVIIPILIAFLFILKHRLWTKNFFGR